MWYLFAVTEKKVARVFECLCELGVSFFFFLTALAWQKFYTIWINLFPSILSVRRKAVSWWFLPIWTFPEQKIPRIPVDKSRKTRSGYWTERNVDNGPVYVVMERTFHDNKKADSPSVLNPYVTLTSELPGVLTLINMSANIAGFFTPDLTTFFPFSIKRGFF